MIGLPAEPPNNLLAGFVRLPGDVVESALVDRFGERFLESVLGEGLPYRAGVDLFLTHVHAGADRVVEARECVRPVLGGDGGEQSAQPARTVHHALLLRVEVSTFVENRQAHLPQGDRGTSVASAASSSQREATHANGHIGSR